MNKLFLSNMIQFRINYPNHTNLEVIKSGLI